MDTNTRWQEQARLEACPRRDLFEVARPSAGEFARYMGTGQCTAERSVLALEEASACSATSEPVGKRGGGR